MNRLARLGKSRLARQILLVLAVFLALAAVARVLALRTERAVARTAPDPYCALVQSGRRDQVCREVCGARGGIGATYSPAVGMLFCSCDTGDVRVPIRCPSATP